MKKIAFFVLLLVLGNLVYSQSIDDINDMMGEKNYIGARKAIDTYLSVPKNQGKADGWYFKGRIYNALSYDSSLSHADVFVLKTDAFDAFLKYLPLDTKEVRMKMESYLSFLDLFYGFNDLGIFFFNDKDYKSSFNAFKKSMELKDFILQKKYDYPQAKVYTFDTSLILNTATAAAQAKLDAEAVMYFKQITDANISSKDYQNVYEYLADYYSKKGEMASLQELLVKARKFFPQDDFWDAIELGDAEKSGDAKAIRSKYEERIAANPTSYPLWYDYSVLIYNTLYTSDNKDPEEALLKDKLTASLKEAIKYDKGIDATILMSNHLYNVASDYSSSLLMIKGNKPEDTKKRSEFKALTNKAMDDFIPYGDAVLNYYDAQPSLKPAQKANYRSVAQNMSEVYNYKVDAKKAAEYDKKRSAPDKQ